MIIGLQRGLEQLGSKLEQEGYKIIYTDKIKRHMDVYVYHYNEPDSTILNLNFNLDSNISLTNNQGVLLINAKGRNESEVVEMIKNRCYSSLDLL